MRRPAAILLLLVLAFGSAARADEAVERARRTYAFSDWPPSDGVPRDGVDLARVSASGLVERSRRLEPLPGSPALGVSFSRPGASEVELLLQVHVEPEPALAREALLVFLAGCQRPFDRLAQGAAPGEVAFAALAGSPPRLAALAFVRANVAVTVRWVGAGAPEVDLATIAAGVDALILESPRVSAERPLTRARVVRFAARGPAGPAGVPLELATDGPVAARAFRASHGAVEDDPERGLVYVPLAPGRARLEVFLLSQRGLRTSAPIEIDAPR